MKLVFNFFFLSRQKASPYHIRLVGHSAPDSRSTVVCKVRGKDAYIDTGLMVVESAMCLLKKESLGMKGGVSTPAAAFGMPLVERLRLAGVVFDLSEDRSA